MTAGAAGGRPGDHLTPLGDTGWQAWRWGLLRAAGFPADGPERFAAPDAAAAADALLAAGPGASDDGFVAAYEEAVRRAGAAVHALASDPLFREAVTWQNPAALATMLDPVVAAGPAAPRNSSRRQKEAGILRYWSRYCGKNDTIGFFGPVCWLRLDRDAPALAVKPGPGLVRERRTYLERWALQAYADVLGADEAIRAWLPAAPLPMITVTGRVAVHPTRGEIALSPAEAAVLSRCDGRLPAVLVARAAVADPAAGVRREADALLVLAGLVQRQLATWGIDLPLQVDAEAVLRDRLAAIGDAALRERAEAGLAELAAARDAVAAAAGDPDALRAALAALDATFVRLTGREPVQAAGRMYAGRTLCWEDTTRDLDLTVGGRVLDALAPPLALLLTGARWLSAEMARVYLAELRAVHTDLAAEHGGGPVPLAELWFLAQGLFFGATGKPADAVADEFARRWTRLLGLDADAAGGAGDEVDAAGGAGDEVDAAGGAQVRLASADLADAVAAAFPAERPGWGAARYHSPDVHLLATDPDAVERGEFSFVLGELHAAWNAADSALFVLGHPDPDELLDHQRRDLPRQRVLPLFPLDWPRLTARTSSGLRDDGDLQLGFVAAPGADRSRLLPTTALTVSDVDGELTVAAADGRRWPLVEVCAELLGTLTVDAFKLMSVARHTPRVSVDRLVVARETWRRTAGELGFATVKDERRRYLAARRWRAELGLPERVFVSLGTEVKPFSVDLTSPIAVGVLATAVRSAVRDGGPGTTVTVSEQLPGPEHAWVPDAAGRRYASELRLQVVDPVPAAWAGP